MHKSESILSNIKEHKGTYLLLAIIVTYAVSYSLLTAVGPSKYGDDMAYAGLSVQIIHGGYAETLYIYTVRFLQIFPIALFYLIFGVGLLTSAAWNIASFVITVIATFFLGKELYNERVGLLSSLLMCFFPLVVKFTGTMSDDLPLMMFIALAVLSLVCAHKRNSKRWYFAAGMLVLAPIFTTPLGFVLLPFIFTYLFIEFLRKKIKPDRTTLFFVYGLLVALTIVAAINFLGTGNPLFSFTSNAHYYSQVGTPGYATAGVPPTLPFYFETMFPYKILQTIYDHLSSGNFNPISLWRDIDTINYNSAGFYFYIFVIAAIYLIAKKEKRAYIPLLWFAVVFAYLEIGPENISLNPFSYLILIRLDRYLIPIAIPVAIIISMGIVKFLEATRKISKPRLLLSTAVILFLIVTAIPVNEIGHGVLVADASDMMMIAGYIKTLPTNVTVYYLNGLSEVEIYSGAQNPTRFLTYDQISNCSLLAKGSYVVMPKYVQYYSLDYTPNPQPYCPSWQLVFNPTFPNLSAEVTSSSQVFRADLYYIP